MRAFTSTSKRIVWPAVAALLVLTGACKESTAVQNDAVEGLLLENGAVLQLDAGPGLQQTLEVENERLHPGDMLQLKSIVKNTSNEAKRVEALVCKLEVRTDLVWDPYSDLILCFAYSVTMDIAPGDSIVMREQGIIRSRPGRYTMVVRHLLRPDIQARVRIPVYPADEGR